MNRTHYHRVHLDQMEPPFFEEIVHSHDDGNHAHTHEVTLSPGYTKADKMLPAKRSKPTR